MFFVSNRSISLLLLYFLWSSNFPLYLGVGCFFFFKRDAFLMKIDFFILYILANFTFFLDVVIFESTNEFSRWIFHILCFFFIGFLSLMNELWNDQNKTIKMKRKMKWCCLYRLCWWFCLSFTCWVCVNLLFHLSFFIAFHNSRFYSFVYLLFMLVGWLAG